jgi:tRNA1Val (adenine37-N6)-methyltransferase
MVAQRNSSITIQAIEIDTESAEEAQLNFNNSPWSSRLRLVNSDFTTFISDQQYDLIISNPPYFENGLLNESKRKANTRHEDSLPLMNLFQKVESLLTPNGHFWLILPYETASKWKSKAEELKLFCLQEITVDGKPNLPKRTVFCFSKIGEKYMHSSVVIRNDDNSYTEEYKNLTVDFHGVKL